MNTSASSSPHFRVFQAAQVKLNDRGFLSKDITVRELLETPEQERWPEEIALLYGFRKQR